MTPHKIIFIFLLIILNRNRYLQKYPPEKIIEYVNSVSGDIQKYIEASIDGSDAKETFQLVHLMTNICNEEKPQELSLALKLKAESDKIPPSIDTNGVNFS